MFEYFELKQEILQENCFRINDGSSFYSYSKFRSRRGLRFSAVIGVHKTQSGCSFESSMISTTSKHAKKVNSLLLLKYKKFKIRFVSCNQPSRRDTLLSVK
ncbi:hypothetical protein ACOME3_007131 [Neoechinorhynchus agilis]